MTNVELEGLVYLCFFDDGSWFQGTLLTRDKKQYGVMGEACGPPEEGFAECCFEEEPLFYMITIIDRQDDEEMVFKHVMKTGGDNCTLTSNEIDFETEELLVGSKASNHVNKYCRSELKGKESIVCSGHMTIHRNVEQD
ncbi:unnamed protein product [Pocillopora meandrina]|uniref:Uncharacterized protein n=3 Tax=Pocillopora TaxID=46730 RepID=A0AAU9XJ69_9CNID|nr:unnamed protein product [Pocillopora meandrina]